MSAEEPKAPQRYTNFRPTGDVVHEGKKGVTRYGNFRPTPDPEPDQEPDGGGEFKCRGKGCTRGFKLAPHLAKHEKSCEKAQAVLANE